MPEANDVLHLDGIDGSNPLGFLAALGTLRTLSLSVEIRRVRMRWSLRGGAWRPLLITEPNLSKEDLVEGLANLLADCENRPEFDLGRSEDNLAVVPSIYRAFLLEAIEKATPKDRATVDFGAGFASDVHVDRNGKVRDTAFRTMSGAGHQHFLGFMRAIIEQTRREHIEKTLFEEWRYDDPLQGLSLRWEPTESRRHAYQWVNPSQDPTRGESGGMLGANRLAIEAIPLFPSFPGERTLLTTGFKRGEDRSIKWTWPIWGTLLPLKVVKSVLPMREVREGKNGRELRLRGIETLFQSTRISDGYYRNFTMGTPIA